MAQAVRWMACYALVLLIAVASPQAWADQAGDLRAAREQAIAMARAGRTDEALTRLAELRTRAPDDTALLHDQTTVLYWAGRDAEVLGNATAIDATSAPAYVINAVAGSARNLRRYPEAETWYRSALNRDAANTDAHAGLAMTLADAGRAAEGAEALAGLPARQREQVPVMLAEAYVQARQGQYLPAIATYDRILAAQPGNVPALRGKAMALKGLLLPEMALELAAQHPGVLTPAEQDDLRADQLMNELRYAMQTPAPRDDPHLHTDRALAHMDAALAGDLGQSSVAWRIHSDRLVALVERLRYAEAVAEYETLITAGRPLPAYAHTAAGEAYIALERPEDALTALTTAVSLAPDDMDARTSLFFAYSELEQMSEAQLLADQMVANFPQLERVPGSRVAKPNTNRLQAELLAARARAYADKLPDAEQRLEDLMRAAPANPETRLELANTYRWRGWNDRALNEYLQAQNAEPDWVAARSATADLRLERQEWQQAHYELEELRPHWGNHHAVRELDRNWKLHDAPELRIETGWGESTGNFVGSDQHEIDTWLFSSPIRNDFRVFAHTFDAAAEFEEGEGERERAGVGADYRAGPWNASAEVHFDRDGGDDAGFASRLDRRLSDTWSVGGLAEFNSYETPLRADLAGVESDLFGVDASYRASESFGAGVGLRFQDFTDGNTRTGVFADARQRLVTQPRYKLDLTGGVATSRADTQDVPYFSPERDFELSVGLDNEWIMYRRYEKSLRHYLHLGTGLYDQKSYGSDGIWDLRYEFAWSPNAAWELRGGWQRAGRVYDGDDERETWWTLNLYGRLL